MAMNTVIFDMDGLLIDSEPLWEEAGQETLQYYGATLSAPEYNITTGLRTKEWIEYWFEHFKIDKKHAAEAGNRIVKLAIEKIDAQAIGLPGVDHIFRFFREKNFRIGIATSSPVELIDVVTEKLSIRALLDGFSSAEDLDYGKPHPQVYLNCAIELGTSPLGCVCFEDSVNGMIAAKAARMKCVVIPHSALADDKRFGLADLQLSSLLDFTDYQLDLLMN